MNDGQLQQVNEYIQSLIDSKGGSLEGLERNVFARYQESRMSYQRMQEQANELRQQQNELLQRARALDEEMLKTAGHVESLASLLWNEEMGRRNLQEGAQGEHHGPN